VCARTALTDSSRNKKQLQGTIRVLRNFFHVQFCVVAWETEDRNKINIPLIFSIFVLNQTKKGKKLKNIKAISSKCTRTVKDARFIALQLEL